MCSIHRDRRKHNGSKLGRKKRRHRRNLKINISVPDCISEAVVKVHVKHSKGKDKNYHHLLFFKREWDFDNEYSQLLRQTPYFRVYIEREHLHNRVIHAQMKKGIPVPPEHECKRAYNALKDAHIIGNHQREAYDSVLQRLDTLIRIWTRRPDCIKTVQALKAQRLLFQQYYKLYGYPPEFTPINPSRVQRGKKRPKQN